MSLDNRHMGKERADFMVKRGHKNVAYIGSFSYAEYSGLAGYLRSAGIPFTAECCIDDRTKVAADLPELIYLHKITGIIAEGGVERSEILFKTLAAMPEHSQPELLVRNHGTLLELRQKYPNVKIAGIGNMDKFNIGVIAADMLANHLKSGKKMTSIQAPAYSIQETCANEGR